MILSDVEFRRKFSFSMYKNQKLNLSEMTFTKDFVNDKRGDMYPVLSKTDDCQEVIEYGLYCVRGGQVARWFSSYFPFATYELTIRHLTGKAGFAFHISGADAKLVLCEKCVSFDCGSAHEDRELPAHIGNARTMIVSLRPGAFDVYFRIDSTTVFFHTFRSEAFDEANDYSEFSKGYAALHVSGDVTVEAVSSYIDCGISQADIRPIRYENGDIMIEQGKVYLTASIRMQEKTFQGVFSWIPGTAELHLTGAVFYDAGDGKWCGDVAASVLYVRDQGVFYLWVCSFNHGHILGWSSFEGDLRFGVNVVDITLMEKAPENAVISCFAGMQGDEDPDFFYDANKKKWLMAICRMDPAIRAYRYVFFESNHPFKGYTFLGNGYDGAETGGSFVKINGEQLFVCGNDFHAVSNYRIYDKNGMRNAKFDLPDGGFRGWGTLMPIKLGSRTRYFWLTFDRHNGSSYNWSYGNIYCFEGDLVCS